MKSRLMRGIGVIGATALLVPAGAAAKSAHAHGHSHGRQDARHGHHGHHRAKVANYVFLGTVVSVDATAKTAVVHVAHANHWGRSFVGQDVTFDLSSARVRAHDANLDGTGDLADVVAGDHVLVQARLARDASTLVQPLKARRLVDVKPAG